MKNRILVLITALILFCSSCEKVENISLADQASDQLIEKPAHFFIYSDIGSELRYVKSWGEKPLLIDLSVYDDPRNICISQDKKRLAFNIFGSLYIYDLENNRLIRQFTNTLIGPMKWSTDNNYLYVFDSRLDDNIFELNVSNGNTNSIIRHPDSDRIVSFVVDMNNSILFTQNENVLVSGKTVYRSSLYKYNKTAIQKIKSEDYTSTVERGDGLTVNIDDEYKTIRSYSSKGYKYTYYTLPYSTEETNQSLYKNRNKTLTSYYSNYTVHFTYKDALGYENKESYPYFTGRINGIYY